ncbi:Uncharacterised protein [Serratia marcescens]|nr:Uncharacterised protein [Serratia marcescens]
MADQFLDAPDNVGQLQRGDHPDHHAAQAAQQPGQQPVPDEDGADKAVFGAQGAQHRDVGAFVFHRHHQRGHDVEAGHADHQHHRQVHDGADHLDIAVHVAVLADPALDVNVGVGHFAGVAHQFVGGKHVVHLEGDTRDAVTHVEILLRVGQRHQRQAVIELAAELQNAGHVQANTLRLQQLHFRVAVGDHHRHIGALLHAQRVGHALAEDHLLFAGLEVDPGITLHILRQRAQPALLLRIHAFDFHRAQLRAVLHQAGKVNVRRGGHNARHLLHPLQNRRPAAERLIDRFEFAVRHHRQNAVFQLALKAVHRAQADDQHRHPQRDADGGDDRNQRHHAAAFTAAAETQGRQEGQ